MTSASVSASKPLLPLFHSAMRSKPYKLNITVQMYPCSEGTDTGVWRYDTVSPEQRYHICYMRVYSLNAGSNPYTSRMDL